MKTLALALALVPLSLLSAQRPADAPATGPGGTPPDTVFIEDLTWAEVRDLVAGGTTTVIIGTAGTEQKGPHMVDGEHKFVMAYAADKIAREVGALVAPVITYVPEGSWENPRGHMGKPGTITLPQDRFVALMVNAGKSFRSGGFTTVLFLGESGGNRTGMRLAAEQLNELWQDDEGRAFWIDDYYTKGHADQNAYVTETLGVPADEIGGHANILDTSELMFVNPAHIRPDKIAPGGGYENSGVSGDPTMATPELGRVFVQIKIDNAVAQIRGLMDGSLSVAPAPDRGGGGRAGRGGRGVRGRGGRGNAEAPAGPRPPTAETAPAGISPNNPPDTVFIEELTWEETRDAINDGKTTVIVPIGGTERNGYQMILGKHNYIVTYAANQMARRLGNVLVAPTIQYVPEGNPDRARPGVISLPSPAYDLLLDAAARSLQAHGFTHILFIGDSGGNQAGMRSVAATLNAEWADIDSRVFSLNDYYETGSEHYRAWMLAAFGYDRTIVGGHAGISDTSQMLFVHPEGIRTDRIMPWGGPSDSGVSGDPTRATAEIGKMGLEFKINAGLAQYREERDPGRGGRGGRGGPRTRDDGGEPRAVSRPEPEGAVPGQDRPRG
jgi:creatinine amidohydrolase/Fe(II)-dependent formamide hydrolase-like protein